VIRQGIAELKNPKTEWTGRVRRPGGGRKRVAEKDADVVRDLEKLFSFISQNWRGKPLISLK
jgi:hypothetical protein